MKKIILVFSMLFACLTINAQSVLIQIITDATDSTTSEFPVGDWRLQNYSSNDVVITLYEDGILICSVESLIAPPGTPAEIEDGKYSFKPKKDELILKINKERLVFKITKLSEDKFSLASTSEEGELIFARKFSEVDKFFVNYMKEVRVGYKGNNNYNQNPFFLYQRPKSMPYSKWCTYCHGNGKCIDCMGTGEDIFGAPCANCKGTGECPNCEGRGLNKKK